MIKSVSRQVLRVWGFERGWMKTKKVTIADVAKRAGVSTSTVSMILNGKNKFPETTYRRVIDACNELGYVRSEAYRVEEGAGEALIAVVPTLSNLYFVSAVGAMQRKAKELGYSLLTFETFRERAQEARIMQLCHEFPFAGALFLYPPENDMLLKQLEKKKPVVFIYDKGAYDNASIFEFDGLQVGAVIGEHLFALGHRRIAYLSLDFEKKQVMRSRRLEGLRSVYKANGLDPIQSVIACTPETELLHTKTRPDGYELGYLLMKRLIERRADITAVATLNDMIAIGAIDAIIDAGKRVPEDYSVCGIDNVSAARYRGVSLTSVESYPIQAGHEAVSYLVRRIEQEGSLSDIEDMPESIMRIEYIPKLIVRKSTGPRRK